ncbi:MAG: hypothetical protein WA797_02605 [Acidimicrobiales bacterium]
MSRQRTGRLLAPDVRDALMGWVYARALMALAFVVAIIVSDELVGGRTVQLHQGLFAWDGAFYRDIADYGYDALPATALRFFPLLPMLARLGGFLIGGNVGLALLVVVNVSALVVGVLLHRLAVAETGDRALGARAAWVVALLPPATVLVLGYAEALMMGLTIASFLRFRNNQWWSAAGLGFLAGLSRPLGVALVVPTAIEAARGWSRASPADRGSRLAAVVAPLAGLACYLAWVEIRFEDWHLPLRAQTALDLRGDFVNPIVTILDALGAMFGSEGLGEGLHAPWIVLYLALLVVVFRRWPASYGAYATVIVAFSLSAESLGSFERYGLSAFPLILALAQLLDRPPIERAAMMGLSAAMTAFAVLIFTGSFVP